MQKLHDLNDMAAFAKVVQAGGFTAAANHLGLPKSNISRRISRLEHKLGVRLLERTTRRLNLTDVGEVYFQHCQRILEEASFAAQSVDQLAATPGGRLRISAPAATGQQLFASRLAGFLEQYPGIQLQLSFSHRPVDPVEEGFDIAVQTHRHNDTRLTTHTLATSAMGLYASTDYIQQQGRPTQPQQLKDHTVLVMAECSTLRFTGPSGAVSVAIQPRAVINDVATLCQLALDGCGIAVLPDVGCREKVAEEGLIQILPEWSTGEMALYISYPAMRGATPKIKAFVEFITRSGKLSNTI